MQQNMKIVEWKWIEGTVKVRLSQCWSIMARWQSGGGGIVVVVVEVYLHTYFAFLTLILYGGERSATCPNLLALY